LVQRLPRVRMKGCKTQAAWLLLTAFSVRAAELTTSVFTVRQAWSQWPDGWSRKVHVVVSGSGGPVSMILHGRGGDGLSAQSSILGQQAQNSNQGNNVVLFPEGFQAEGFQGSWNVYGSPSEADDVAFFDEILDHVSNFSNVDLTPGVTLFGYSEGCAAIMDLFIASRRQELKRAVCGGSALLQAQHSNGQFYKRSFANGPYDLAIGPLYDRELWLVHGALDDVVPWSGGFAVPFGAEVLSAEDTAQAWANHFMGSTVKAVRTETRYGEQYVYGPGTVKLFKLNSLGHDLNIVAVDDWASICLDMLSPGDDAVNSDTLAVAMGAASPRPTTLLAAAVAVAAGTVA